MKSLRTWMVMVALLAAAGTMTACGGGGGGGTGGIPGTQTASDLILIDVSVADFDGVALNQTILFEFSELLFPDSVRPDTIQIREGPNYGRQVPGYFRVGLEEEGKDTRFVRFYPQLPTLPDLSDSGLQPGTPYRVIMPGIPQITTVQNYTGDRLKNETIVSFQTALVGSENLYIDNFLDPLIPGQSPGVAFVNPPDGATEVASDNPITFTFTRRPLSPATVNATNITMTMVSRKGVPVGRKVPGVPVLEQSLERVTITFKPTYPLADEAVYALHVDRRVEDLVGNDSAPFDSSFEVRDEPFKSALISVDFTEAQKYTIRDEDNTTAYWNEAVENALTALFTAAGGTGSSGDLTPLVNVNISALTSDLVDTAVLDELDNTLYDEFNFRKVDIPEGIVVSITGRADPSKRGSFDANNLPIKILSLFPMNINGVLNVNGGNGDQSEQSSNTTSNPVRYGGLPGPGAGSGANSYSGSAFYKAGLPGITPSALYGGYPGTGGGATSGYTYYAYGAGGGGAGNRTKGFDGTISKYPYTLYIAKPAGTGGAARGGNLERVPNVGGTGGSSGGNSKYSSYRHAAAGGGGGGGAIKLQSGSQITVGAKGAVHCDGGAGGPSHKASYVLGGCGGGGSGGTIKISSTGGIKFESGAKLSVLGGAGGVSQATYSSYRGAFGGAGGEGHLRFEAADTDDIVGVNTADLTYKTPSIGEFLPSGGGAPSLGQTIWMNMGVFDPLMEEWLPGNPKHLRVETYGNDVTYWIQMALEDEANPGTPLLDDVDVNDPTGDDPNGSGGTTNENTLSRWTELSDVLTLNGKGYSYLRIRVIFQLKWNQKYTDVLPFVDHIGVPFRY